MSKSVGSRELKTRLGTYLRLVDEGASFVVTHRGRPVAELRPIRSADSAWENLVDEMIKLGEVSWSSRDALEPIEPVVSRGEPVSDTIRSDREDRL